MTIGQAGAAGPGGERRNMAKRWYIVHAYSNFEDKVAEAITDGAKRKGLEGLFEEVVVPTERVIEVRRGRKHETERKLFPGYVFVKMEMTDAAQVMIKNTAKVTGFLGQNNKPKPIADAEAAVMLNRVKDIAQEAPRPTVTFEIGEVVKVSAGPFESLNGKVEEVDEERARLKVAVSIFGRETPVELGFAEVQKLAS
jgi:transcriptional antiterminator NusG